MHCGAAGGSRRPQKFGQNAHDASWALHTRTGDFLRMAAELGCNAFKLERLALKAESSFLLCLPFCASNMRR